MYRKWFRKSRQIAAFVLAGAMVFGSVTVSADEEKGAASTVENQAQTSEDVKDLEDAEADQPAAEKVKENGQEKAVTTQKSTTETEVSFQDSSYPGEDMVGKSGQASITLKNSGSGEITLSDYEFRVRGTENADYANLQIKSVTGEVMKPGEGTAYINVGYTIPENSSASVIKFVVDIYKKTDLNQPVYTTKEVSIYPYQIVSTKEGNVLKYNDTSKGEKYEIKVETDEHVTFTGLIGGGGGDATEIWEQSPSGSVVCTGLYLRSGYPSSFSFQTEEGYVLGTPELTPADAGIVEQPVGSNFAYTVDLHKPAVLKVRGESECVMQDESGMKFVADATEENSSSRSVLKMNVQEYQKKEDLDYVRENIEPLGEIKAYSVNMALDDIIGDEYTVKFEGTAPRLYIPIPEGWDTKQIGIFVIRSQGEKKYIYESDIDKISSDGKYVIYTPAEFSGEFHDATATFGIFQKSQATEAKLWKNVALEYITNLRYVNWGSDLTYDDYFFKDGEALSANAVGMITRQMEIESYTEKYRVGDSYTLNIPYDVFVKDAAKYFRNVPDLKQIEMQMFLYYDEEKNVFIIPEGGVGDEAPVIDLVRVDDLGSNTYAIRFHFNDRGTYESEVTLVVEDNGQGEWRYLSFLKGYPEIEPVQPVEPEDPDTSGNSFVNPNPGQELSKEFTDQLTDKFENAAFGSVIRIEMKGATKVPAEVLNAIKGRNVDIVLDMGTYMWTINGKDITVEMKDDIDLKVTIGSNSIPENLVETVAGENTAIQISLSYDGAFGFRAELRWNIGAENKGKTAKLYYYNEDESKVEFVQEDIVESDGSVAYTFEHASDYVVVLQKETENSETTKPTPDNTNQSMGKEKTETTQSNEKRTNAPKTGDTSDLSLYVITLLLSGGAVAVLGRKKIFK